MSNFERYMSLKRFGTQEVRGIEEGKCFVFPKVDGTNASCWQEEGIIYAGSRNRLLDESSDGDNGGFCKFIRSQSNIKSFFEKYKNLRLFGEWLIPHSLKTYKDDAWKKFYVFDVYDHIENRFLSYNEYLPILEEYKIHYIPLLCTINNPTIDKLIEISKNNTYLIKDGEGIGEGIVIKNYNFKNKYDRVIWAKLVSDEFREKQSKKTGKINVEVKKSIEELIIDKYFTDAFIEKEYNKLLLQLKNNNQEWSCKMIPQLLGRVYYEFLKEEPCNFVQKLKNPTVNFKVLNALCINKIKNVLKDDIF